MYIIAMVWTQDKGIHRCSWYTHIKNISCRLGYAVIRGYSQQRQAVAQRTTKTSSTITRFQVLGMWCTPAYMSCELATDVQSQLAVGKRLQAWVTAQHLDVQHISSSSTVYTRVPELGSHCFSFLASLLGILLVFDASCCLYFATLPVHPRVLQRILEGNAIFGQHPKSVLHVALSSETI